MPKRRSAPRKTVLVKNATLTLSLFSTEKIEATIPLPKECMPAHSASIQFVAAIMIPKTSDMEAPYFPTQASIPPVILLEKKRIVIHT
jgi:hypothetical protein